MNQLIQDLDDNHQVQTTVISRSVVHTHLQYFSFSILTEKRKYISQRYITYTIKYTHTTLDYIMKHIGSQDLSSSSTNPEVNSGGKEVRHFLDSYSQIQKFYIMCSKTEGVKQKTRCGNCSDCVAKYCGTCYFCQDMKTFGGSGRLKKACIQRKCQGDRNQQQPTAFC